ncbi:Glutamine-binding periplasmic protein [Fundidesulfovibrio magnetotacticus]|uniref:Glutamine-binding periplasmic protein n=1 Tax=Fundidesulfovibrio magnetotacticus TaxID=2730080 RepID=A0A6V8LJW4_9BACT|nr:transporter substrate-binding domain-containing protein [Fundidesulfovibrio magnetotacticus]GFK93003.1 Glutamine-binding periplasmic protein [Fundidesulfovibrio magnetotacticus]
MATCIRTLTFLALLALSCLTETRASARDLDEIRAQGVLRHLGVPYAAFVTGNGDGFDVELMRDFAAHLGVGYEYVATDWPTAIQDLVGRRFTTDGADVTLEGPAETRGDVLASGLTVLPWREKLLDFSAPVFPTQVWLVVRADSALAPIAPTGEVREDIRRTREKLMSRTTLTKSGTCLDPRLFDLAPLGVQAKEFTGSLNDLAPAVIVGEADTTLLDVPDVMVALQKFPGRIKVIGPMSEEQQMAVGFRKDQPALRAEFARFFEQYVRTGRYMALVERYYPLAPRYFPRFFPG